MAVNQIYGLVNDIISDIEGLATLKVTDNYTLTDLGEKITSSATLSSTFLNGLVDRITKVWYFDNSFEHTPRKGILKSVDEWGGIMSAVNIECEDTVANSGWSTTPTLTDIVPTSDGYTITNTIFKGMSTYEYDFIIYDHQLNTSFTGANEFADFANAIFGKIDSKMEIYLMGLENNVINTAILQTVHGNNGTPVGMTVVNLGTLYHDTVDSSYTPMTSSTYNDENINKLLDDVNFLRFAYKTIGRYQDKLKKPSILFNIDGKSRWSTDLITEVSSDVQRAFSILPNFDPIQSGMERDDNIAEWQGSGTSFTMSDCMTVKGKLDADTTVTVLGVACVLRDAKRVGMFKDYPRMRTFYDPKHERTYYYNKKDTRYYSKSDENMVVFTLM